MIDLGFTGPKFTWTNKKVLERIDRGICNMSWRSLFSEAYAHHLPRTKSDHCPIKICLNSHHSFSPKHRPFCFEAMWLRHEIFKKFVAGYWSNGGCLVVDKLALLVNRLRSGIFKSLVISNRESADF